MMKFEKKVLDELDHCYAVGSTVFDGERWLLFAAENDGPCYAYEEKTGRKVTVWEHPGGTMSMIQIPDTNGEFLAVQGFRSGFMAQNTSLAWVKPKKDGAWEVKTVLKHPFIHRFDILTAGGVNYLLICTLATTKENKDDWSDPGKLWVGTLPKDLDKEEIKLSILEEGMLKNHGYCRVDWEGKMAGLTTCAGGLFLVIPPQTAGGSWTVDKLIDRAISDVAAVDIDGDGQLELATIEPFHGNQFVVNKKTENGYEIVYRYPNVMDFGHVVWGGYLQGEPCFIGGNRRRNKELFLVRGVKAEEPCFSTEMIDVGQGPSNIAVLNEGEKDVILAANREIAQAALYTVTK